MKYKKLGNTDIKLPAIGIGTGFNFEKVKDTTDIVRLIEYGIDLGIQLIDTAEVYGNGTSEKLIGQAINKKREKVFIATKFSPEHNNGKGIRKSLENSLKRLKTDYIDLYQFHWPNPKVPLSESILELEKLIKEGKIRYFGLGNFSNFEITQALDLTQQSQPVSLQTEYNLFERTIEQNNIYTLCKKNNLSLIAYSPLDQGRINSMNAQQLELINGLSKKYTKTTAQIILNWLTRKDIVFAIPKTTSKKHLLENYEAMNFEIEFTDIKEIDKLFFLKLEEIPVEKIRVSLEGEGNKQVYQTLEEALANKFNFTPGPSELATDIKRSGFLKPVRLIKSKNRTGQIEYDLIGGRIRYWAWVIAFGDQKPIPAYVRENI